MDDESSGSLPPTNARFSGRLHIEKLASCFLCARGLPLGPVSQGSEDFRLDDRKQIAICDARVPGFPLSRISRMPYGLSHFSTTLPASVGTICYEPYCEDCESNETLYFAHQDCWKVARARVSIRSLFHLARATRPLFPAHLVRRSRAVPLVSDLLGEIIPSGRLPTGIGTGRRLPPELRDEILRHLQDSYISSLLTAAQAATLAASPIPGDGLPTTRELNHDGPVTSIHGRVSRIFGREYLVDIGFNGGEGRHVAIAVEKTDIVGIRFALDIHGLRAIRVKYSDKSISPWLGNPGAAWYGDTPGSGTELRRLQLYGDALRIIRINLPSRFHGCTPAVWSSEAPLEEGLEHVAHVEDDENPGLQSRISWWADWRLCPYLPLASNGSYISGLTAYYKSKRIIGWSTHGNPSMSIGSLDGAPIHFPLHEGERITAAYVYMPIYPDDGFCAHLLVATNRGRTHFFGPHWAQWKRQNVDAEWIFLVEHCEAGLTGLFCDKGTVVGVSRVHGRGEPREAAPKVLMVPRPSPLPRTEHFAMPLYCFSSASLRKTSRILSRRGTRVRGLLVEHHGSVEVLGAWDPVGAGTICTIYDSSRDSPLTAILVDSYPHNHGVADVNAVTEKADAIPPPRDSCRRDKFFVDGNDVMWWFNEDLDNVNLSSRRRTVVVDGVMAQAVTTVK